MSFLFYFLTFSKEVSDFRANTQRPQFEKVLSMTMANGLFSWTNGEIILTEEYHRGHDSYFHNLAFPSFDNPGYVSIGVDLPSAQPVPLPVNPPTGLQAIVSSNHARATWNIPHLLGGQGVCFFFIYYILKENLALS